MAFVDIAVMMVRSGRNLRRVPGDKGGGGEGDGAEGVVGCAAERVATLARDIPRVSADRVASTVIVGDRDPNARRPSILTRQFRIQPLVVVEDSRDVESRRRGVAISTKASYARIAIGAGTGGLNHR